MRVWRSGSDQYCSPSLYRIIGDCVEIDAAGTELLPRSDLAAGFCLLCFETAYNMRFSHPRYPRLFSRHRDDVYVKPLLLARMRCVRYRERVKPKEREMDLQEVADGMTQRVSGKSPLGGTLKFDL